MERNTDKINAHIIYKLITLYISKKIDTAQLTQYALLR